MAGGAGQHTSSHCAKGWDGAGDGARTRDLLLGRQALCQLSYSRIGAGVGVGGFEPSTSWSQAKRSNQTELHPAVPSVYPIARPGVNIAAL